MSRETEWRHECRAYRLFTSPLPRLFAVWIGTLLLTGGAGQATERLGDYFPLALANRWQYESSEGTPTSPVTETWEVVSRKGAGYVLRIRQSLLAKDAPAEFVSTSPDGVVMQPREARSEDGPPQFILKPPLTLGTTWKTSAGRYEITALQALTAVPAGVFEGCIEVTFWSRNGQAKAVTLYAPGVGMVQRDESFSILGGLGGEDGPRQARVSLWLTEWQVGPATADGDGVPMGHESKCKLRALASLLSRINFGIF